MQTCICPFGFAFSFANGRIIYEMRFMGVCPHWTPQDFRGPVPTGIFVGLSPLDFQGPVPAVDYESSRGRDNHVMIM